MKELKCDLHIVGGALTGLLTAYCAACLGYSIIISEKKNILAGTKKAINDKRTTAIAEGSKIFLESQGLWKHIKAFVEPIFEIKVIDQTANSKLSFANPRPKSNLGYIVKNSKLISQLIKELKKKKNVNFLVGSRIASITYSNSKVISFSNNNKISSSMIIAADGKNSAVRKILGTSLFKKKYSEKALVINFFHERPHKNIAYEFFLKSGPFAILPMQKEKNEHQSALIWSNKPEIVDMISSAKLKNEYVKEILNEKIHKYLGKVINISSVQAFPLSAHMNEKFYHDRTVYVGDAAHSIHPIAGQGWNLGLRDVKSLIKILKHSKSKGFKIGTKRFCKSYNDLCFYDAYRLFQVTDKLDWIFKKDQTYFKFTKKLGFDIINKNNLLKKQIVNFAMGI
tara:strand:+ start:24952 stop:26142 length:1191 start_codon:yes stop_codon:yes gene_type:complete